MIALIPARGGSKGLYRKNIRNLAGKPLISHSIAQALASQAISRVIVSTDDEEIAAVSRESGAEIPYMRPPELATDTAMAIDVYNHAIETLEDEGGIAINEIMVLLPTSPLRDSQDIDNALSLYSSKNADSIVSFCEEEHPLEWHRELSEEGRIIMSDDRYLLSNRQEFNKTYYPNGSIYLLSKKVLRSNTYYSDNTYAYIMPRERSFDIDTELDFKIVEMLINRRIKK